jgi:minor curlin subunit
MCAKRNSLYQKNSIDSCKSKLAGILALSSILAASFSGPVLAAGSNTDLAGAKDLGGQQLVASLTSSVDLNSYGQSWQNTGVIAQIGVNNNALIAQSRDIASYALGNYAAIYQNGNDNEANILQSGGNNIGLIGQIGDQHQATIEQHGNSFEAQVNQAGYNSQISISQSGSGLRSISVGQSSISGMAAPVTIRTY